MPSVEQKTSQGSRLVDRTGMLIPVLLILAVGAIVVPLPSALLDLCLSINLTAAAVMLMTVLYVRKPLDFSSFPVLLLGTTLVRLVLNIASTRLILTQGAAEGTQAAGRVIEAFGEFVAGGQLAIGLIIFLILLVVQFLVINQGAARISEVAARFALDGLPGRQSAIDADLQAGSITPEIARQKRETLTQQSDFYGAMDGAGKFVRGDSLAGLVIVAINILGGLYVGVIDQGLPLRDAVEIYTKLTIGDGLITQIPAFLIALAAGLLTTRSSVESDLPGQIVRQFFVRKEALVAAAVLLVGLSLTGLPPIPLLAVAACLGLVAWLRPDAPIEQPVEFAENLNPVAAPRGVSPEDRLFVEPLELELGYGLICLADTGSGGELLERISRVRSEFAQDMGTLLPRVKVRDNLSLSANRYQIRIHDVLMASGEIQPEAILAIEVPGVLAPVPGIRAIHPVDGRDAIWIEPSQRDRAIVLGYHTLDATGVVVSHLASVVRGHCDELLSRQQVYQLLEALKQRSPRLVEELIPGVLSAGQLHQVLCRLLHEQIPIRNLETILETLGDFASRHEELWRLTERVRHSLSRSICQQYRDKDRLLKVMTIDAELEASLTSGLAYSDRGLDVKVVPTVVEQILSEIATQCDRLVRQGRAAVVLTTPDLRAPLKHLTEPALPALVVLSTHEITRDTKVESIGQVHGTLPKEQRSPQRQALEVAGVG